MSKISIKCPLPGPICLTRRLWRRIAVLCLPMLLAVGLLWQGLADPARLFSVPETVSLAGADSVELPADAAVSGIEQPFTAQYSWLASVTVRPRIGENAGDDLWTVTLRKEDGTEVWQGQASLTGSHTGEVTIPMGASLQTGETYRLVFACPDAAQNLEAAVPAEGQTTLSLAGAAQSAALRLDLVYGAADWVLFGLLAVGLLVSLAGLLLEWQDCPAAWQVLLRLGQGIVSGLWFLCAAELLNGDSALWKLPAIAVLVAFLLYAGLALVLRAVTGRTGLATALTGAVLFVVGVANHFVLLFRGTPFTFIDILSAGTGMRVAGGYHFTIQPVLLLGVVFLLFGLCTPALRLEPRLPRTRRNRWLLRLGCLAAGAAVLAGVCRRDTFQAAGLAPSGRSAVDYAEAAGAVTSFAGSGVFSFPAQPDGYSPEALETLAEAYPSDEATAISEDAPNVLLILSESFTDFEALGDLCTDQTVLPFWQEFTQREDVHSGTLVMSTLGGGTVYSEFQVLTGITTAFDYPSSPYTQCLDRTVASLPAQAAQLGYTTAAVHPAEGANYNRVGALPWLGFDTCVFREDLTLAPEDTTRGFMRDSALFRQVTGMLEETDDPMFLFCITMQNHGGYTNADYESPVQLLWPEGCDEAEQYLGLVHESDAALAELIGALEELDEPTLVIFFGDHQPELGSDFSQAVLDESDPFAQYTTPYLIWANYPLEEDQLPENGSRIGIAALNPLVARAAGFPLTGWQKFLLEFYTQTPVMAQMGGTNAAGEYLTMEQLKQQPLADEYQILQYAMLFAEEQETGLWRLAEG